jgi:vacuolar-type H+-ATPase subunit E/Vma4
MGLEELVARLEQDADTRVAEIEARSRREVDAIEAESARAASRRQTDVLAEQRAERRARLGRELAEARRRTRAEALRARGTVVDRVMARAAQLLDAAPRDPAYVSAVAGRLRLALGYFGDGVVVRCRPELAPAVTEALAAVAGAVMTEEPAMAAGVTLSARDGSMDIDDTLPTRLAAMRDELAIEVLRELADER